MRASALKEIQQIEEILARMEDRFADVVDYLRAIQRISNGTTTDQGIAGTMKSIDLGLFKRITDEIRSDLKWFPEERAAQDQETKPSFRSVAMRVIGNG